MKGKYQYQVIMLHNRFTWIIFHNENVSLCMIETSNFKHDYYVWIRKGNSDLLESNNFRIWLLTLRIGNNNVYGFEEY